MKINKYNLEKWKKKASEGFKQREFFHIFFKWRERERENRKKEQREWEHRERESGEREKKNWEMHKKEYIKWQRVPSPQGVKT